MKLPETEKFRPGKTREDRMPVADRPRVLAARKRRELAPHERAGVRWDS